MSWADEIEAAAGGEPILMVCFGGSHHVLPIWAGRSMPWGDDAKAALAAGEEDDDYWKWPIIAWTESRVIFTHDYDTFRDFMWLPRNPGGDWSGEAVGDG